LNKSDDDFIISVLNNNINLFNKTKPKYTDYISLLSIINSDIKKLTLGLDVNIMNEKIKKLNSFIYSKLKDEINLEDLNLRINICDNFDDYKLLKKFIELINNNKEITSSNYIKLNNDLNFLEYDLIKVKKSYNEDNDVLFSTAKKTYDYFISNIDYFTKYGDYNRVIELIYSFNFEPNLILINKYLTFYNTPGNLLDNVNKFTIDKNLGKLYYKIKNYSKAKMYLSAANANPLIYEDVIYAFQKWDILLDIFYCNLLDSTISKEEKKRSINYIKGVFEDDINRISNIKNENISRVINEIKYKYNVVCLHEAKEQNDLLKESDLLIEQININNSFHFFDNFYNELDLNECKLKLNKISNNEKFILNTELYKKYNKSPDILYAIDAEKINDFSTSFIIQLNIYTKELIANLKYINKLSYSNQFVFFTQIWDHRQFILRPYFKLSDEDQIKYSQKLIEYFILSDNIDGYNSNLFSNNETKKIDELIVEKKKLINNKLNDEDFTRISNNIDYLQQQLKANENNSIWNFQQLKENLKENQAYIRIFFNYGNYYAFVVTKTTLKLVDLNSNNTIDFQKAFAAYMKNLKEQEENPLAYDVFYSKIFNAIPKEINELFFQNEGVYINLNPDGFKSNSNNKYLIESYDIHTINTSYNFTNLDSKINFENALFIGNPIFQSTGSQINKSSLINNTRGTLLPLPNTQNEVLEVSKLLTNENISTKCLLQAEASENNLNTLASNFDLIHIATHGFYKDDGSDKINQYDFGLYLTGALDYINNNQLKSQMIDEGIVYAPEIELLNLSKTKLVVLSACETGFGRQSKIGKISLTSSFIMAGAKNVLSTLWKVDDKVTMEFINAFYSKLLQLKNIKSALKATQIEFLEKYKSPYYWAPFMLLQNRG
jgi:CHAT domain-containing protein